MSGLLNDEDKTINNMTKPPAMISVVIFKALRLPKRGFINCFSFYQDISFLYVSMEDSTYGYTKWFI